MRKILFVLWASISLGAAVEDPALISSPQRGVTNTPTSPGPDEGKIAQLTADILSRSHFSKLPVDDEVSARFFNRYLESLDNLHLHFLKSDLLEFDSYRTNLDNLILKGDTSAAHLIFARFLTRVEQRAAHVNDLLKNEKFTFEKSDRYALNRKEQPRPENLEEARALWRQHLRYEYLQEKLNKEKPEEIIKTLSRRYSRFLRTLKELDQEEVFEIFLTSLTHVYDPHSDYMSKSQLENFAISMKLSLTGIGAVLTSEDGYCKITQLMPGGPAEKSGKLKPNDKIIAVAQGTNEPVDVVDMKLNKVVDMIRGPKGSEVRLTIIPASAADPSQRKQLTLIRDEVRMEEQEAKAKVFDVPIEKGRPLRLGVIDLPSFYADFQLGGKVGGTNQPKSTTADVTRILQKLKSENVDGIILDLRRNGGGSLEEAIRLTGLFIKRGPIVQVKEPDGKVLIDSDEDPSVLYDGPMIVLTSRFSASASEILAGALQDYGRALLVGDSTTHGKGTVQTLLQLGPIMRRVLMAPTQDPGAIKLTIRKFYRASGSSTQRNGVTPDIVLPSVNNFAEVGEAHLDNPLPWDTVESARYEALNRVKPFLAPLQKASEKRIQTSQDFVYMNEDIDQFKKLMADKSVSLNEEVRLREKKDAETRSKARKKEVQARKETGEKVYEVTLKNLTMPGLQVYVPKTNDLASSGHPLRDPNMVTPIPPKTQDEKSVRVVVDGKEKKLSHEASKKVGQEETPGVKPVDLVNNPEEEEDKTPVVDVTLVETKRILADWLQLLKEGPLSAGIESAVK